MDGKSTKKSASFETLVIQNITNVSELKSKLCDIITTGKDYEYDVYSCMKTLINSSDQDIMLLSIQAVSELVKCEEKRKIYANKDIIMPILEILQKETTSDCVDLKKQSCRALGNLCCDCDTSRQIILESDGIPILIKLLQKSTDLKLEEIQKLVPKTLLNYALGGSKFSESIVQGGLIDILQRILCIELEKPDFDDDIVSTCITLMNVINDNIPDFLFDDIINKMILKVLRETTDIEMCEMCLDHLHTQAEHDSVKIMLAKEDGVQLVCQRLEELVDKHTAEGPTADDSEVEAVMKQACDLIIIVLTGDEAMHILYNNGVGDVYMRMVKWLDSTNHLLLTTAVLAIGNFARQDDYCSQMMHNHIFDKLLDMFETHAGLAMDGGGGGGGQAASAVLHALAAALRNLSVAPHNKRAAAASGRAAPLLLGALPHVRDPHVAYKLLAAVRMLLDGQESVAQLVAESPEALGSAARWALAAECAGGGAAGEAPRLLAWTVRHLPRHSHLYTRLVQVEGCISSLVNMLVASHSLMQNEAILALTLLAMSSFKEPSTDDQTDFDYEKSFVTQLIKSEIGKHLTILIETNCAKMPIEVAENLLAFLDVTCKNNELALDYKLAEVHDSLNKFSDSRSDLSGDVKNCISGVVLLISDKCNAD